MNKEEKVKQIVENIERKILGINKFLKDGDIDRLSLGISGMYLSSIIEHLFTMKQLLEEGFIESAGVIATSLWERSITLQYIMTDPINLSQEIIHHRFIKRTPWSIKKMIKRIVEFENTPPNRSKNIDEKLLYFQYTFLCTIKHGNPHTLIYLNRLDKSKNPIIGLRPNLTIEDNDLKIYILLLLSTTILDTLIQFSHNYCILSKTESLQKYKNNIEKIIIKDIQMNLPNIMKGNINEFDEEYLKYVKKIFKKLGNGT